MSLQSVSDEYLAIRAARGDGAAFAELARRYRRLLGAAVARVPEGGDREDARQEALLGLYVACRATDGRRRFAGIAKVNVRWRIARASRDAATLKRRVLTHALRDPGAGEAVAGWLPALESSDPAHIVELREQLRDHMRGRRGALPLVLGEQDARRRHSAATIAQALELVARGHTVSQAARAVGASYTAVREWIKQAPRDSPARRVLTAENPHARRYSDQQRRDAVELVTEHGHTYRQAAAAVGVSQMTVHRWVRAAA
jgi:RNA polymerase sigma factor (sigma-70 family)